MSEEKRRFTRVPFKVEAEIQIDDTLYHTEDISNLSVGGCLLPIQGDFEVGTSCRVKISLGGTSSELNVRVEGEIARNTPEGIAVKFTGVDLDSLFHLKNIVRYNSSDADAVEKEIRDHFGIV